MGFLVAAARAELGEKKWREKIYGDFKRRNHIAPTILKIKKRFLLLSKLSGKLLMISKYYSAIIIANPLGGLQIARSMIVREFNTFNERGIFNEDI